MHPIPHHHFGYGNIKIYFHDGTSLVSGYIVRQIGSKRYVVTADGTTTHIVQLKAVTALAELTAGTAAILGGRGSTTEYISKLDSTRCHTATGNYTWSLGRASQDVALSRQYSYSVQSLGTFGGSSCFSNYISPDGSVIVGSSTTAGGTSRSLRWTAATGLVDLGVGASSDYSSAYACSADGSVIFGLWAKLDSQHLYRWTETGGAVDLGANFASGGFTTVSCDDSGDIAFVNQNLNNYAVFRWTSAGLVDLGIPGQVTGCSADGSVISGQLNNGDMFRWTASSGLVDIPFPETYVNAPTTFNMSRDGSTIIGFADYLVSGNTMGWYWREAEGFVNIGWLPGGNYSQGYSCNADGSIITAFVLDASDNEPAAIWTVADGFTTLPTLDPSYAEVSCASADGSVLAGDGTDADGNEALMLWTSSQ